MLKRGESSRTHTVLLALPLNVGPGVVILFEWIECGTTPVLPGNMWGRVYVVNIAVRLAVSLKTLLAQPPVYV